MLPFLSMGFPWGAGMAASDPLVLLAAVSWVPGECQVCQERGYEGSGRCHGGDQG